MRLSGLALILETMFVQDLAQCLAQRLWKNSDTLTRRWLQLATYPILAQVGTWIKSQNLKAQENGCGVCLVYM